MGVADRRPCIVGVGQSEYTKWGGIVDRSQFQVTAEAIVAAARDAGLAVAEIDGMTSFSNDGNDAPQMQVALGIPELRWSAMLWGGGGGGSCGAVSLACAAVESGQADVVAVYRGLCQGQGRRFGLYGGDRAHGSFIAPFGMFAPSQMLAPLVMRYMHMYGVSHDPLCEIAMSFRANASRNPASVMGNRPMSREDYFAARWIAEPFRLYDCCLETDGAAAVIVTTRERARDLDGPRIDILAAAHGSSAGWSTGPLGSHNMPDATYSSTNNRRIAREIFGKAGLTPADIDVAQIYDHFSGLVLLALEDFGFCKPGEAGDFVTGGGIRWPDGGLPLNTSGGQLSEAYVHGVNLMIEGVRQLRGTSTSQVAGAGTCLVTSGLGTSPTGAMILGRA